MKFPKIAKLNTADKFQQHLAQLRLELPFSEALQHGSDSPLSRDLEIYGQTVGNRFCILPMEGWDGTPDGRPSELTYRRWQNFGRSGAKLIWGGEAVAVRPDGRANPNQLLMNQRNQRDIEKLRQQLELAHQESFGSTNDLCVGLQLTHSGRFARPHGHDRLEPRILYRHPWLDRKFQIDTGAAMLTDDDLKQLIDDFVNAAQLAGQAGFRWVDIKHCHGYLGHELLSAYDRPGEFGGSFENRTRFLRDIVAGIMASVPDLRVGVRVSIFDFAPFVAGPDQVGKQAVTQDYPFAWGGTPDGHGIDFNEPIKFMELLTKLGIQLVCTTAGSPYYNPHIQRPAAFPPSDGYLPPEDPLVGVARQIKATAQLKQRFSELVFVGSGYSYLQDWLPHVAQACVDRGLVDCVGLGRMALSYPELPADVLAGKSLQRQRICRTFSDCTTAPRHGLVSGCYPLDRHYKQLNEYAELKQIKKPKD